MITCVSAMEVPDVHRVDRFLMFIRNKTRSLIIALAYLIHWCEKGIRVIKVLVVMNGGVVPPLLLLFSLSPREEGEVPFRFAKAQKLFRVGIQVGLGSFGLEHVLTRGGDALLAVVKDLGTHTPSHCDMIFEHSCAHTYPARVVAHTVIR